MNNRNSFEKIYQPQYKKML